MVHFYTFRNRRQVAGLRDVLTGKGYTVVRIRKCGNVAPGVARWVFELKAGS